MVDLDALESTADDGLQPPALRLLIAELRVARKTLRYVQAEAAERWALLADDQYDRDEIAGIARNGFDNIEAAALQALSAAKQS